MPGTCGGALHFQALQTQNRVTRQGGCAWGRGPSEQFSASSQTCRRQQTTSSYEVTENRYGHAGMEKNPKHHQQAAGSGPEKAEI